MASRLRVCHTSQRVPVEAILGDDRVALDETGRRVQVGQRRDRIVDERPPVGEQRLVDRALPGGESQSGRHRYGIERGCDSSSRTARSKPTLIAAIWAGVGVGGPSSADQRNAPPTTSTRAQPPDQPVEPTVRPQHHVGVAVVQHPAVRLQHTEATTGVVDELDVIADQPPAQRRQRRDASARTRRRRRRSRPTPSTPSPPPAPARTRTRRSPP